MQFMVYSCILNLKGLFQLFISLNLLNDWPINILQMFMARTSTKSYCISRHGWYALGKRTALLCIIFAFFNQGGEIWARDFKKEVECELIPAQ